MNGEIPHEELPFAAPCRHLPASAPWQWVIRGWHDLKAAPFQTLSYGLVIAFLGVVVTAIAWRFGTSWMLLLLLPSFVFAAPVLAMGLYAISSQLEHGEDPTIRRCIISERGRIGDAMIYSLVLLVVFLLWMRAGTALQALHPRSVHPSLQEMAVFLGIGSAVGAVFALLAFAISAFSLPMLLDRRADGVTAAITSINAVRQNKPAMLVWIGLILLAVLIGFATAFIGLIVTMPLIGLATWHGYRDTIDASAWPANS